MSDTFSVAPTDETTTPTPTPTATSDPHDPASDTLDDLKTIFDWIASNAGEHLPRSASLQDHGQSKDAPAK